MTRFEIARRRLHSQRIVGARLERPADVVAWLGAVQAQDYPGAKWALGLRLPGATDDAIERAFTAGAILRTHLLRPTWHFVTPSDIRWMLALTASRVHEVNAYMYRKLELDGAIFKRSGAVLAKALRGRKHLTRDELRAVLEKAGIDTKGEFRMGYLMMRAELDGIVCSGPRRGKHSTYALLDERAPPAKALDREAALAKLAHRYFTSRGPATVARSCQVVRVDRCRRQAADESRRRSRHRGGQSVWQVPRVASGAFEGRFTCGLRPAPNAMNPAATAPRGSESESVRD